MTRLQEINSALLRDTIGLEGVYAFLCLCADSTQAWTRFYECMCHGLTPPHPLFGVPWMGHIHESFCSSFVLG